MGPSLEWDMYNESGKYSVKGHVHTQGIQKNMYIPYIYKVNIYNI